MKELSVIFLNCIVLTVFAKTGFGPTDQEWGYVTVREGAHMFWWLHYTNATTDPLEKPLIIWLQGGPGGSSTGYGNFMELGPLDINLNVRNTSWTNYANILFVDNPVGTGFSYVENSTQLTTTNTQIAEDFIVLLRGFYEVLPQFENISLYIFCESYGGKMTAEIALRLTQEINNGTIKSNFKGVGLGDSWISPIDSLLTWAPYLYNLGLLDTTGYQTLTKLAQYGQHLIDNGNWRNASIFFSAYQEVISNYTERVDFYNVLKRIPIKSLSTNTKGKFFSSVKNDDDSTLYQIMNNDVKEALNLTQDWGDDSNNVFDALLDDFMKPVTAIVERLLNETDLKVGIYNGELDLIVDTPGTINWVDKLKFPNSDEWKSDSHNSAISVNNIVEGLQRHAGNLHFFWVFRAGHMVPRDNPNGMQYILEFITDNFTV